MSWAKRLGKAIQTGKRPPNRSIRRSFLWSQNEKTELYFYEAANYILLQTLIRSFCSTAQIIICELGVTELSCSNGRINVLSAFYGRLNRQTCPSNDSNNLNCRLANALARVQYYCQTQVSCHVEATNGFLRGDPCSDTAKYLLIDYQCDSI